MKCTLKNLARSAVRPDITSVGATPCVAFRESDGLGNTEIYVKRFP